MTQGHAESARGCSPQVQACLDRVSALGLEVIRVGWMDLHGHFRSKWLTPLALESALCQGLTMVSTLALKDTSCRTAWPVFESNGTTGLDGFGAGNNLRMWPRPASLQVLPWAPKQGWILADLRHTDGSCVQVDGRTLLSAAVDGMAARGWRLRVGLELEFHVYRVCDRDAQLDPHGVSWPAQPPEVALVHPGYQLLNDQHADGCSEVMSTVAAVAHGLGLPLLSVEVEMGPSQFEAVFGTMDALPAADAVCEFRVGMRQALARLGYHASFACRPPFEHIMSSGWHLHHSVVDDATGANIWQPHHDGDARPEQANAYLSELGSQWLAGLLTHAEAMAAIAVPTAQGYARFQPHALAPQSAFWDVDHRGAMLRVLADGASTRIENRLAEPNANPYWLLAAHIWCGLDGVARSLVAPPAMAGFGGLAAVPLPSSLEQALAAWESDAALRQGLGAAPLAYYAHVKRAELARRAAAPDALAFDAAEYFSLS